MFLRKIFNQSILIARQNFLLESLLKTGNWKLGTEGWELKTENWEMKNWNWELNKGLGIRD